MTIYLFGQPASGKTTLAKELQRLINGMDGETKAVIIDGDNLREATMNKDYSADGRVTNIRNAHTLAHWITANPSQFQAPSVIPIIALVSPMQALRLEYSDQAGHENVRFIYLHTSEKRGREHLHVHYFEKPNLGERTRENLMIVDTTNRGVLETAYTILQFSNIKSALVPPSGIYLIRFNTQSTGANDKWRLIHPDGTEETCQCIVINRKSVTSEDRVPYTDEHGTRIVTKYHIAVRATRVERHGHFVELR